MSSALLMPSSISKLCADRKQHFEHRAGQSIEMPRKSLNAVLGANLNALMGSRNLSNRELGAKAGVAPNTVANYRKAADESPDRAPSGKERSAKLVEVERIADALGIPPLALLTDREDLSRQADSIRNAAAAVIGAPFQIVARWPESGERRSGLPRTDEDEPGKPMRREDDRKADKRIQRP